MSIGKCIAVYVQSVLGQIVLKVFGCVVLSIDVHGVVCTEG